MPSPNLARAGAAAAPDSANRPDERAMADGVRDLLRGCGLDLDHKDLLGTPERVARTWRAEFLAGYGMDARQILSDVVGGEADPDAVMLSGLSFHAMCPHHLFPYRGRAHVLYVPDRKLVGFGRISELVDCFTKRLTLQERATHQIAEALVAHLGAKGAGCVLEAEQLCLVVPHERHGESRVVTSAFCGEVRADLRARLTASTAGPA
jgi:GTP cyclohydrolase I